MTLTRIAAEDKRIFLLSGDLGYGVLDEFGRRFPDRFLNAGVAEQNMVGVAAGLALGGKKVFTYSIVNFAITRCLEQIRNDICYQGADVTVVSIGAGVAYGVQGYTHHGAEDIAFTRVLPDMTVVVPGDPVEAAWATEALARHAGPAYLRLARGGEPAVHAAAPAAEAFGRLLELLPARPITILATGAVLAEAANAAQRLAIQGIEVGLFSCPVISPLDNHGIEQLAAECAALIVVEEHLAVGGFGGAVAEVVSELPNRRAAVIRLGLDHAYSRVVGDQRYLRRLNGIDSDGICRTVVKLAQADGVH